MLVDDICITKVVSGYSVREEVYTGQYWLLDIVPKELFLILPVSLVWSWQELES